VRGRAGPCWERLGPTSNVRRVPDSPALFWKAPSEAYCGPKIDYGGVRAAVQGPNEAISSWAQCHMFPEDWLAVRGGPAWPDLCVVGFGAKAEESHRSIMSVQQLSRNIQAEIKQYHEVGKAGVTE